MVGTHHHNDITISTFLNTQFSKNVVSPFINLPKTEQKIDHINSHAQKNS